MKYHILDTHALVWFIEDNAKLSQKAKDAILDSRSKKVISVIVLAEIKFLANKNRFQPKFEHILAFIENDPTCLIYPMDLNIVEKIPENLEIHDGIIAATAQLFSDLPDSETLLITKDEKLSQSPTVKTLW